MLIRCLYFIDIYLLQWPVPSPACDLRHLQVPAPATVYAQSGRGCHCAAISSMCLRWPGGGATKHCTQLSLSSSHHAIIIAERRKTACSAVLESQPEHVGGGQEAGGTIHTKVCHAGTTFVAQSVPRGGEAAQLQGRPSN